MPATVSAFSHVLPASAAVTPSGHLSIGGCDLVELAERFGTPAFVVDEDDLRARARAFVEEFRARHRDVEILFASKAFPCTAVYRVLAEEGLDCDVASGGELALALRAGFDGARIVFHGNAKSVREVREAFAARVGYIVLDSFDDLDRVTAIAAELGVRQPVLLRVVPDVAGDTHAAISTGQADTKFGFSMVDARVAIERLAGEGPLALAGLHFHVGSQLLDLQPLRDAVAAIAGLGDFGVYDLGGGLGVPYLTEERAPGVAEYAEALIGAAHAELGTGARLLIEPGRALVANAVVTIYTVESIKRNVSTWVAVDGGMSDNLRPMLYGARYEVLSAERPLAAPDTRCHIAGKHCESGDVLVRDALLASPSVGEVLLTPATGAYGYAMANNYNGVPRPPVVFCRDGEAREVVRRETYEDLMARDVPDRS